MLEVISTDTPGNDVLVVQGAIDGQPVVAQGWVSATTHYYPPSCYDGSGNLIPGSTARAMTPDEAQTYYTGLLAAG